MNCRSVSPKTWEHARQALVFYFTRRQGVSGAEDLAQETLMAVWNRENYEFAQEEDFLKVCYGFAIHILQASRRSHAKLDGPPLDPALAAPIAETHGLRDAELNVYLQEILRLGKEELRQTDWQLIRNSASLNGNRTAAPDNSGDDANTRVKLHRARRKLALLAGWRKG